MKEDRGREGRRPDDGEGEEARRDAELDDSDEEDDTDPRVWSCGDAPPRGPWTRRRAAATWSAPPSTEQQHRDLIGRKVLIAHLRPRRASRPTGT